jgi:hypothetical protein
MFGSMERQFGLIPVFIVLLLARPGDLFFLNQSHLAEETRRRRVTQSDVQAYLDGLSPEIKELVLVLRDVIHRTVPQVEESLLWGGLSYHRPQVGGRVKGAVCQIDAKRGQVRLDFIHGIRLLDPCGLLQGHRKSKRFVPIATVADAERPEVADMIRAAAGLDPTEWA